MEEMETCYAALSGNMTERFEAGSRVAVYGTGQAAFRITEILAPRYAIAGYLDRDKSRIGERLYHGAVIDMESARDVDAIVIAAKQAFWDTIYLRILDFTTANNIAVLYPNGLEARLPQSRQRKSHAYWNTALDDLESACSENDVFFFDIFDTLLMRKLADPKDVFAIVEVRLAARGRAIAGFALRREQAEHACLQRYGDTCTLRQIYEELAHACALSPEDAERALRLELDTESRCLAPRHAILSFLRRLIDQGKRVMLASDMYLTRDAMRAILARHGITGYERLFISCEERATKSSGALWEKIRHALGDLRCLHIGDNLVADVEQAARHGVAPVYVMSAPDMLRASTLSALEATVQTSEDSLALGLFQHRLFNDPFVMHQSDGRPPVLRPRDYGYLFFGPLAACFLGWLTDDLRANRPDLLLFGARDGYLFHRMYQHMRARAEFAGLPDSVYVKTSRRACTVASFQTEQDVLDSLALQYAGSSHAFFRNRLGIEPGMPDQHIRSGDPLIQERIRHAMPRILDNARRERKYYMDYLSGIIPEYGSLALFDSGQNGTVQYYLGKILDRPLVGRYIFYADKTGLFAPSLPARALYTESQDGDFAVMSRSTPLLESVFTESNGTYLYLDSDGHFVCDESASNHDVFPVLDEIHQGIREYWSDYYDLARPLCLKWPGKSYAAGALASIGQARCAAGIMNACRYEDSFRSPGGQYSALA